MDGSRFDAWTRRRFGLATAGALAAALSPAAFNDAVAKRKKRKKRCRKINQPCRLDSKKRCCRGLQCDEAKVISPTGLGCCRHFQARCESEIECCTSFMCQSAVGLSGKRCCGSLRVFCTEDGDCCDGDGVICGSNNTCCIDTGKPCTASGECCPGSECFKEDPSEAGVCKEA